MSDFQTILTPVAGLMCLAFLFSTVLRRFYGSQFQELAFGVLFGLTIVLGMINPISLGDGLIFDTRTLLLVSAVAFGGPLAGGVALGFGVACRIVLGGAGMTAGVAGLVLSYGLACLAVRVLRPRIKHPVVFDAALGLIGTGSIIVVVLLPVDVALGVIRNILPTLLISNAVGVVAIGLVCRREMKFFAATKAIEHLAQRDPLTNLFNRRGLDVQMAKRRFDDKQGHALFYFDIDNFKTINDDHGHDAGDAVLSVIAARIRNSLRKEAVFTRHGGDEFSIYLPGVAAKDVEAIGDRLCNLVAQAPIESDGIRIATSISMGAYWSKAAVALEEMIRKADGQLLLAKRAGKNRVQVAFGTDGVATLAA